MFFSYFDHDPIRPILNLSSKIAKFIKIYVCICADDNYLIELCGPFIKINCIMERIIFKYAITDNLRYDR